jgi:cytochrome b6-f complex iron-sulfur subunit
VSAASLERRAFLRRLPVISVGLAAGATTMSIGACAGAAWVTPRQEGGTLVVARSAVAEGGAFVAFPGSTRPIYLHRAGPNAFIALHAQCTHQGCQPEPVGERMICPCHGSEFSLEGAVLQGPAERPLPRFEVREQGEELMIMIPGVR